MSEVPQPRGDPRGEGKAVSETYIVRVLSSGDRIHSVTHVGPFPEDKAARRYAERITAASNGTLRTEVIPLHRP